MEKLWQQSYAKNVPLDIEFEAFSLPDALSRTASRFPETAALIFEGVEISFRELDRLASRFGGALQKKFRMSPGDRVGILMPNLVQTAVAVYGILRANGVVTMLNPRLEDLALKHQIEDSQINTLVCLDVLVPRMVAMRRRVPALKSIISCHIRDYLPFLKRQLFPMVKKSMHLNTAGSDSVFEFKDLIEDESVSLTKTPINLEDTAFILYTSATTGLSKGVELSHNNVSRNVQQVKAWFPNFVDGKEIVVGCLPFFHVFGLTCALNIGVYNGYANVLVPLPEPKSILEAVHNYKATFVPALPTMYIGILAEKDISKYDMKSLKGCFSGGAPLPKQTIKSFERIAGAPICEGYGLTETSPVTHINPFGGRTKVGAIGLPVPGTDAKIVDPDDYFNELTTPGEAGELCIRGPQVMKGYLNLPVETDASLRDGWLLTGDIVTVDAEGYFSVVDRKKEMIVSDGNRIYPRHVEEALFVHSKVHDACAIGIPDKDWGESVKAFIVLKKGETATAMDIINHCRNRLPWYMVPSQVEFLPELPRSPVGKTQRRELKRLHLLRSHSPGRKKDS